MFGKKEFGDYQTPKYFCDQVCKYLKEEIKLSPEIIIEPTCGKGSFIESSLAFSPECIFGIEINPKYVQECKEKFKKSDCIQIFNNNIFDFKTTDLINNSKKILILGNPPWVTNTELSTINSTNIPNKSNSKNMRGFDAMTGASNFDICEYIIIQLVEEYKNKNVYFSQICKTSVARNIYEQLINKNIPFDFFECLEFDARKVFNISAQACLMTFKLSSHKKETPNLCFKKFETPKIISSQYHQVNGRLCQIKKEGHIDLEGQSCFEWRQGVKHDCSKIMELTLINQNLINANGETVEIENSLVYPLVKSSMFKSPIKNSFDKFVIITQKHIKQDTSYIKDQYPKTWEYLSTNADAFRKRKSSIYLKSFPYSIFGIGDYSFSKYKVGISGFYKKPLFMLLYSENKPVMVDDTGYFISFDSYNDAYTTMLLLNSNIVQSFLESISFKDAKRPFTKKLLSRLDFRKIVNNITLEELSETENRLGLNPYITNKIYDSFKKTIPQDFGFF